MGAHLKKQNICFYFSLLCSVAIIVLMFLPWLSFENKAGEHVSAALFPDFLMECIEKAQLSSNDGSAMSLLIFLVPLGLGIIGVHVFYIIQALRPGRDVTFPGTVSVLLSGIMFIIFVLGADVAYNLITVTREEQYTDSFIQFLAIDKWTWLPIIWFVISLLQKWIFARIAHKKEVVSYV